MVDGGISHIMGYYYYCTYYKAGVTAQSIPSDQTIPVYKKAQASPVYTPGYKSTPRGYFGIAQFILRGIM